VLYVFLFCGLWGWIFSAGADPFFLNTPELPPPTPVVPCLETNISLLRL